MLAFRNLFRRKIRTILSVIGVGVGIASIVAFSALGAGFKQSFTDYANQSGADVAVFQGGVTNPGFGAVKPDQIAEIRKMPDVVDTARTLFIDTYVPGIPSIPVLGRDPNERLIKVYTREIEGRTLETEEEVMLGKYVADVIKAKIGNEIMLIGKKFKIVGIFKTSISWENASAIMHINVVNRQRKQESGTSSILFVYAKPGINRDMLAAAIMEKYPDLKAVPIEKFLENFKEQIQYVDTFVWVVSVAALAVGCIGVLNTLLMSVSERTREIGTLRAVGWNRKMILHMIVWEGFFISIFGVIAGIAMGVGGAELLIRLVPRGFLDTYYDWEMVFRAIGIGILVGTVGSLYPAYAATRLTPAEALRYE